MPHPRRKTENYREYIPPPREEEVGVKLLTPSQVATRYGVTRRTVYRWIDTCQFPVSRIGWGLFIREQHLKSWEKEQRKSRLQRVEEGTYNTLTPRELVKIFPEGIPYDAYTTNYY